ncbi:hypothetical protein [Citrobacter braakii]|uniref:Uncharacterized protein n=1 Tax=Citrobacter braakii TaxID=57706 RepID=A0A1V8NRF0_CITBR|nr:hypothetical protein [Citrobacter braakii]OQM38996.1 hypothetical protein BZK42_27205 [Citrobacter braakii]
MKTVDVTPVIDGFRGVLGGLWRLFVYILPVILLAYAFEEFASRNLWLRDLILEHLGGNGLLALVLGFWLLSVKKMSFKVRQTLSIVVLVVLGVMFLVAQIPPLPVNP